jgi:hypothetical protein
METQSVPVSDYEKMVVDHLSQNKEKAYNYLELGVLLSVSRKRVKNIIRILKLQGKIVTKPMKGTRRVRAGYKKRLEGLVPDIKNTKPDFIDKEMTIAYVMINKSWLDSQKPKVESVQPLTP